MSTTESVSTSTHTVAPMDWLLAGDPAIRWQVERHEPGGGCVTYFTVRPGDNPEVLNRRRIVSIVISNIAQRIMCRRRWQQVETALKVANGITRLAQLFSGKPALQVVVEEIVASLDCAAVVCCSPVVIVLQQANIATQGMEIRLT